MMIPSLTSNIEGHWQLVKGLKINILLHLTYGRLFDMFTDTNYFVTLWYLVCHLSLFISYQLYSA